MSFITYSGEKDRREFNARCIANARKALQHYPLIFRLVKNFDNFESVHEIENPFFWSCVRSQDTNPIFSNPSYYNNILKSIEEVLRIIGMDEEKISRATSLDEAQSYSLFSEILLFNELSKKVGLMNIHHAPNINNKVPDYVLKYSEKEICIEQTSLISGETEKKLKRLFKEVAKQIYPKLRTNTRLSIQVNSFNLDWDEKTGLDIESSQKKFIESLNATNLYPFFNIYRSSEDVEWDLGSLTNVGIGNLEDHKDVLKYFEGLGKYLADNSDSEPCKSFLKNSVTSIKSSPILGFFSLSGRYTLIDLQTNLIFPSELANVERRAWLNSLTRKVEYKIKEDQFSDNMPNILFINADLWCLHDYYKNDDPDQAFVKAFLIQLFENLKDKKISAIVLYNRTITKNVIVINPYASNKMGVLDIQTFI